MPPEAITSSSENPLREKLIDDACDGWKNRLIDLSRRNNLLFYKPLVSGTLELTVNARMTEFLKSSEARPIMELLRSDEIKISNIRVIARKGLENLEEKGLSTLYLALGKCSWTADDGGRNPVAPVLLVPIELKLKGQDIRSTEIKIAGDFEINPVLIHILNRELNVPIQAETLLREFCPAQYSDVSGDDETQPEVSINAVLDCLTAKASKVPDFRAEPFAVIGNFSFQKLAMVKDLENRRSELQSNDVVAAIAGDATARRNLGTSQIETDPASLDTISPDAEFAVVEADSSQQCAIVGIAAGQSAVVHGPPGTGKSQTITNLIATLTANGKKILFVAEKRAALEVVMNRLASVGLDHLAIDLHGADQAPKKVMERVARTLGMIREAGVPAVETIHSQFVDRRDKLNQHDSMMHTPHAPTGQSVYAMQGTLLRLPAEASSPLRWRGPDLLKITFERSKRILDLLQEAAGFETLFNRTDPSPWCGIEFQDGQAAQNAIDFATRLAFEEVPALSESLHRICVDSGLRFPKTMAGAYELLKVITDANRVLDLYHPDIFKESILLLDALSKGRIVGMKGMWVRLTSKPYKTAFRRAIVSRGGVKASADMVYAELTEAAAILVRWQELSLNRMLPKSVPDANSFDQIYQAAHQDIRALEAICKSNWSECEFSDVLAKISVLAADNTTPYRISQLCGIERELFTHGVQRLIDEIRSGRKPSAIWGSLFQYVWLNSTLDMVAISDPSVRAFVGTTHNTYVEDFKRLDSMRLELAAERVCRAHAERTIAAMNQFPEQESIIRAEAARTRRHKPLRKTFAETKDVLTAVCPCWMASPLSVCHLISATGIFDYVIFDEASQILPEDAVPAILRGKHVIVAGDNKQLPPNAFFAAAEDEDEADSEATSYESLLDMMIPFVKGFHLNWHYRSRDEALISFSNHHIYHDRLVTFPSPGGTAAISHLFVDYVPSSDGHEDSSGGEVQKVVELVIEHARTTPDLTLGVITMGVKHTNRIQAVLDREIARHPQLGEFFDTGKPERFFVKNLERVQGDERDVIILSVGYGKDRAGNLPLRFGPILSAGGRRRLNVAATRAKERVIVVSSFRYSDINSAQVRHGTGLEFLKDYIEYASSGGKLLSHGEITDEPMNDFEMDIYDALSSRGISLVPQVGCSKFRIDFAACHPSQPGKFVLAIECDGATHHSSYTARDRDRLRQQQLENLGWTFHRIWSTDWFTRRDEEIERAVQAFNNAVKRSDIPKAAKTTKLYPFSVEAMPSPSTVAGSCRTHAYPPIPNRSSIDEYTPLELKTLLQWVKSDGKLRTNDELADEMFAALPFARRGSKIEATLRRVISRD